MGRHQKLTQTERQLLANWKKAGLSNKECARRLGRHPATIGRELRRNSLGHGVYNPDCAHRRADKRKARAWGAKRPLKNADLYGYVISHLRMGWSPEQIAGRLRHVEHPGDPHWLICKETIYEFVYSNKYRHEPLNEYLRRKQKKRRKRNGRKVQRVRIPDRVSIHERPQEIEEREVIGHWEGDTVVGRGHRNGLHTAYERVSSLILAGKMNQLTAAESIRVQRRIYARLPESVRRSVTLDNGTEHVLHAQLHELNMQTYFADPYSACQRGGNENANLWLRYYFPKGTDFGGVDDEELYNVVWELNSRPRKRLHYQTPLEVFNSCLNGCNRS